jgi:ABC-type spermidine/putrescine transport system permease subunit II
MSPGIAAGALLAFVFAWDELMIAIFLTGPATKTLTVTMWDMMAEGMTPVVPAGATLVLLATLIVGGAARYLLRVGQKKTA